MNVLVVGGAGYIGGAITDPLMQSAHNVRVYDTLLYEECYHVPSGNRSASCVPGTLIELQVVGGRWLC